MTTGGAFYLNKKAVFMLLGVVLGIFFLRMAYSQYLYMEEAEKTESLDKVKAYERVILSHFPLSPYTKKAVQGSLRECESFKEDSKKLYCYETLRSSLIQIKSFYQPYEDELEKLKPVIAHLRAMEMIKWKDNALSMKDYQSLYESYLNLLKYENAPSNFWSAVGVFSLIGWISALLVMIFKGLGSPIDKKYILIGIVGFVLFLGLWIIGLYKA